MIHSHLETNRHPGLFLGSRGGDTSAAPSPRLGKPEERHAAVASSNRSVGPRILGWSMILCGLGLVVMAYQIGAALAPLGLCVLWMNGNRKPSDGEEGQGRAR